MLKEKRAQTSLEYLLILGGAVMTATIVGIYLKNTTKTVGGEIKRTAEHTPTP
ncbi:MAG: class III signal peptide-containing protein [Candidatus Diapherotrites archaeon]|nr:class III signal peptide-containing protein [Candidatus Diapherotrites archaeon]